MYIIYKYEKNIYIGDFMINLKEKLVYSLVILMFLVIGVSFGYISTVSKSNIKIDNVSLLEYARNYTLSNIKNVAVSASSNLQDIEVVYEDNYLLCGESINTTKMIYGSDIDKVKEDEKKYQEEKGLKYEIKEEKKDKIVYARKINENCPNHFLVILEDEKIVVYSIKNENKKSVYMNIDNVNVEYLRKELKNKIEEGAYINSREELNRFIEDLES